MLPSAVEAEPRAAAEHLCLPSRSCGWAADCPSSVAQGNRLLRADAEAAGLPGGSGDVARGRQEAPVGLLSAQPPSGNWCLLR